VSRALRLSLDRDDRTYRPGERLAGEVAVESDRGLDCHAVEVWLECVVEGRAPPERSEQGRVVVFRGYVPAGALAERFHVQAPAGPLSYAGELVRVAWRIHGQARLDLRADLRAEEEIRIVPWPAEAASSGYREAVLAPSTSYEQGPTERPRTAPPPMEVGGLGAAAAGASGAALILAGGVGAMIAVMSGGTALLLGGLAAAAAGAGTLAARERLRAAHLVGKAKLSALPEVVVAGQPVVASLRIAAERATVLPRLSFALIGEEVAALEGESDAEAHHAEIFFDEHVLRDVRLVPGEAFEASETFTVPEGAAPSFSGRFNEVRWEVRVTAVLPDGDAWRHALRLSVQPRGAELDATAR
jgi:hypothetical protein